MAGGNAKGAAAAQHAGRWMQDKAMRDDQRAKVAVGAHTGVVPADARSLASRSRK
mgnify:CR=1 FL=1